ncbi:hypothetical protein KM043_011248 [Ampulex compressa]|nr:hypothetical protein KM043_011248 [Ampulex compressa]
MFDLLAPVKRLLDQEPVCIDNFIFRLHYRATVSLLLVCMILVTAKQYIGEPISCITDDSIDKDSVNAYCWIYGTFTVSRHLTGIPGRDVASAGVGQFSKEDKIHHHKYYQWVYFVLGLQALLFYAPSSLWRSWENGTIGFLSRDLGTPFLRDVWTVDRKSQLVRYFAVTNLHTHNFYAFRFLLCELLNLTNAVGQIYLLDLFLEGQFRGYGTAVATFAIEENPFERIDPMARLFPKVTKCTIRTFGSAGSPQIHDALCVLPLNVVNEKVFVFVWFWLVFLSTVSTLAIIYRIILFSLPCVRMYYVRASARGINRSEAGSIVHTLSFGDWFLLHQLARNLNPIVYRELLNELVDSFTAKHDFL